MSMGLDKLFNPRHGTQATSLEGLQTLDPSLLLVRCEAGIVLPRDTAMHGYLHITQITPPPPMPL
jgi:hypothetical protein